MTRSELITKLMETHPELLQNNARLVVKSIFDKISSALEDGQRVELRGFGAFISKERNPRKGRNPRTGDAVDVEAKYVPLFKMGKQLRERLK